MKRDPGCIFCKIVAGEIPSLRIYEDDSVFAFLDIGPLADGHLLVIPKEHHERMDSASPDLIAAVARTLPMLSKAVMSAVGVDACNILLNVGRTAGQEVLHMHFHIIPRTSGDGLGYRWMAKKYPAGRADEVASRLRAALESDN